MSKPSHPPAILDIHPTSIICQDSLLSGKIKIHKGCVIHPKVSIIAGQGEIILGSNCVVEEMAVIINKGEGVMRIGDHNVFMVGSRVESPGIGNHNVFHPRCIVSNLVQIPDNCNIGAGTIAIPLQPEQGVETLPPYTVIYGSESSRRIWDGSGETGEKGTREKHLEYLREIIPKYNRIRAVGRPEP